MKANAELPNLSGALRNVRRAFKGDDHHRLRSWDHCWKYWRLFLKNDAPNNQQSDLAALHLAFYLASFGMYRGSADLRLKDYKALLPIVDILKTKSKILPVNCIFLMKSDSELIENIQELAALLTSELKRKEINPSDILLSKMIFVTLGWIPAFDSYVKTALKNILKNKYPTGCGFSKHRLKETIALARRSKKSLLKEKHLFVKQCTITYAMPLARIFDFYLWQYGGDLIKDKDRPVRLSAHKIAGSSS